MSLEKKLYRALKENNDVKFEEIFEQIYYEYCNLVAFIISKYVSNKEDVEELTNDVFIAFYKSLFKNEIYNFKYYLVTSAKNVAINHLKKVKIDVIYNDEYILTIADADESMNDSLYQELLDELKKYLNEFEINVIILHNVYEYSIADIAKKNKKPRTSISSTYHRAIKKFNERRK